MAFMKQILSILRHVRAIVVSRMRARALIKLRPGDASQAFRILAKYRVDYIRIGQAYYIIGARIHYPMCSLLALEKATGRTWGVLENIRKSDLPATVGNPRVERLLLSAFMERASDIFVTLHETAVSVQFRVCGQLKNKDIINREVGIHLIKSILVLAGKNINNVPQNCEGHFRLNLCGDLVFFRLSFVVSSVTQSLVLRLLSEDIFPFQLERLQLPKDLYAFLNDKQKDWVSGMILISGPTGSGKTTTAYSLAKWLLQNNRKIISIEDPIEAEIDHVLQTEVNKLNEYTFDVALKSVLRQDPNVILLGEIRDAETAKAAFYASLSGYLVITTIHAECLDLVAFRCQELGIDIAEFKDSVTLQIHQTWDNGSSKASPHFEWYA